MSESRDEGVKKKRRGVRASRIALERALGESDLEKKTQAALAERIADLEGLDAAPKDLVSKVFRELRVDLQSLDRIARALGVETGSLLRAEEHDDAEGDQQAERRLVGAHSLLGRRDWRLAGLILAGIVLIAIVAGLAAPPYGPLCSVGEMVSSPRSGEDRFGIVIARFTGDRGDRAQEFLATSLANDAALRNHVAVVTSCARPRLFVGAGELRARADSIRRRAQKKLRQTGAQIYLWGETDRSDIIVRFISLRRDNAAKTIDGGGRPLRVNEAAVEVRISLARPDEGLADLKRLALELSEPQDNAQSERRDAALAAYDGSAEWLSAAIVSQRNIRRTISREINPQAWAGANMRLCRDLRLLGDFNSDPAHYEEAIEACDFAIAMRPRERFPQDWRSLQIDKSSSLIRLHYFAKDRDAALEKLHSAEAILQDVLASQEGGADSRLVTARRNLGVVKLRIGEFSDSPEADEWFDAGIGLLKSALAEIDPDIQPLDWAITQQNICLSLYQRAIRVGATAVAGAAEAEERCADAEARLRRARSPLDWAMAQNNLAAATAVHAQLGNDPDKLKAAKAEFAQAQSVYTRERLPNKWAEVELNLGELTCNIAIMTGQADQLDSAGAHLDQAIDVFIRGGNRRYRRYAENLRAAINRCDRNSVSACKCG